uniref:Uncharacterized protein n=1 Tax=Rhizophora mucronata TaxID=61149 RepID=A0A2P2QCL7_RHIMU
MLVFDSSIKMPTVALTYISTA